MIKSAIELSSALTQFAGNECIGFTAGAGTGSVFTLEFGTRRHRERPLTNPFLTEEQRNGEAEFALFVECAWRLDGKDGIICGSLDDNGIDGPMLGGLRRLIGLKISSFQLREPGLDLELRFGDFFVLQIFCDQVNSDESVDNYSLFYERRVLVVGSRSEIRRG